MRNIYLLFIFIFFVPYSGFSQNICGLFMEPVCSTETFDAEIPNLDVNGSVQICHNQSYPMQDVAFYYVKIQEAGTFTFLIHKDPQDDYDFAVWQNPDCTNLGMPDRTSYLADNLFNIPVTGLALNEQGTCEAAGDGTPGNIFTPGVVRHLDVQVDDEIIIMIYRPFDIFGNQAGDFSISFGGDAELDCTIVGNSYGKCDVDGNNQESFVAADFLPDLTADFPGSQFEYYDDQTNAENGTGPQVTFPHPVNEVDNPSELFVRVENAGGDFQRVVQIFLYVNEVPQLTSPIDLPAICDLDGNDLEEFDLTQAESDLVADPTLYTFKYYILQTDAIVGGNNNINPATAYESGTATIYVRVETGPLDGNEEGCFSVGEINLILTDQIEPEFDLSNTYCLNTVLEDLPLISDNGITGTWNIPSIQTGTLNTTTYIFTPDAGQCAGIFEIEIEITELIQTEFELITTYCQNTDLDDLPLISDNGITGTWNIPGIQTDMPGTTTYIFTPDAGQCADIFEIEVEITELIQTEFELITTYCQNTDLDDLPLISDNGITGTWNIPGIQTDTPGTTTYIFTPDAGQCAGIFEIEIEISAGATLNQVADIELCDGNFDGLFEYNLTDLNDQLINPNAGFTFSYYASQQDLLDGIEIPQNQWNNYSLNTLPSSVWVVVTNTDGCRSEEVEVSFITGQEVQHDNGPYETLEFCENETLDLTQLETDIALETGVTFSYYESQAEAESASNPIADEGTYNASGNGIIFVRLEKEDRCPVIIELTYEERPTPNIEGLPPTLELCEGDQIDVETTSDDPDATFLWTWGNNQSQTGPAITITETGTYTLTVTSPDGCERSEQLTVQGAPQPTITSVESGPDYITVFASAGGSGTLEYSLNGVIWQTSPRFDNLVKGKIYTVYVRENGCMVDSHQIVILDISNFVSPNGDGYNDVWEIRGIQVTPNATIKIFDRYGKIFVDTNFDGNYVWDGKYGGRNIPSGDYWYIMEIPTDGVVPAQKFVGNISIKNQ